MSRIHLIGGEKGGVGKSLVARLLAQYLIDHERRFIGFDSDRSHGALLRFYAGYASPVIIDRYDSLDAIMDAAAEDPERPVLVDLAAQTYAPLVRWLDESDVLAVGQELGISLHYWHVMDAGRDSVDLLARLLDRFGADLNYVLALNQLRGEDFSTLEQSGQKARALELGASVIGIPKLHEASMTRIDAGSTSFWAAANNPDKAVTGLGLLERQRVKVWLRKVYEQLDTLSL